MKHVFTLLLIVTPLITALAAHPDYQPLVDLYKDTQGSGWNNHDNWITDQNPCNWYGISCTNNRVTKIGLAFNNLKGSHTASLTLINQQTSASYFLKVTDQSGSVVVYGPFRVTVDLSCNAQGRVAAQELDLTVTLLGNPIQSETLRGTVSGAAGRSLNVQLLDLSGKPIKAQTWQQAESDQRVEWRLSGQASGVYVLQAVTEADGSYPAQRQSLKIIKP